MDLAGGWSPGNSRLDRANGGRTFVPRPIDDIGQPHHGSRRQAWLQGPGCFQRFGQLVRHGRFDNDLWNGNDSRPDHWSTTDRLNGPRDLGFWMFHRRGHPRNGWCRRRIGLLECCFQSTQCLSESHRTTALRIDRFRLRRHIFRGCRTGGTFDHGRPTDSHRSIDGNQVTGCIGPDPRGDVGDTHRRGGLFHRRSIMACEWPRRDTPGRDQQCGPRQQAHQGRTGPGLC